MVYLLHVAIAVSLSLQERSKVLISIDFLWTCGLFPAAATALNIYISFTFPSFSNQICIFRYDTHNLLHVLIMNSTVEKRHGFKKIDTTVRFNYDFYAENFVLNFKYPNNKTIFPEWQYKWCNNLDNGVLLWHPFRCF